MEEDLPVKLGLKAGRQPASFVAEEWTGLRPWRQEISTLGISPLGIVSDKKVSKPLSEFASSAEQRFTQYGLWERMAGRLAQAPEKPPESAQFSFATGAIPLEEYQRRRKIEEFSTRQMGRLEEIAGMPEAGAELKSNVYAKMFDVSMSKGEYGKAENYMGKSLDEMIEAMKEQAGMGKDQLKAGQDTAKNTGDILREIQDGKILFTNRSPEERAAITQISKQSTINLTGGDWTQDETMAQVKRALRE
jgi:hypothetical protein